MSLPEPFLSDAAADRDDAALLARHGAALLALARRSIAWHLAEGTTMACALGAQPRELRARRAAFVTLSAEGRLRGCVGTPVAWRPLVEDVIDNAAAAAVKDMRFEPLALAELEHVAIALSLLSPPAPLPAENEEALIAELVPGRDGLILSEGTCKAIFLPQVWEHLAQPRQFLAQLKLKAGLPENHWSPRLAFQRFTSTSVAEPGVGRH
ncbi:MAG TPA: AmmeMemoRadiSam system protein A [Thermoanaerobaculia bacterium]|nr:AmmeMemoRadiSam system protein A [Thermoanaerobaculia bacterium]